MREVIETPGKTAALITPDPSIARRVSGELARWGVEVEDSAGRTLGQSEAGALARLILEAAKDLGPLRAQALIAHAAARLGRTRAELDAAARALELGVFRAVPISSLDDLVQAFCAARAAAQDRHAHSAIRAINEAERVAAEQLARDLASALEPLRAMRLSAPLREWLAVHRRALDAILVGPEAELSAPHGLELLYELLDEWDDAASGDFSCALGDYAALFDAALAGVRAPPGRSGHPRLKILGLLEARLLSFDRVILAGLDEKVWPPAVETDAFLNRPMRAELGLSAPERRIGQTAHDFVAALGAREAVISRSKKRTGEPTVASRFLLRMSAAAGEAAIKAAERRGRGILNTPARSTNLPKSRPSSGRSRVPQSNCARARSASLASRRCGAIRMRFTPNASSGSSLWIRSSANSGRAKPARPGTARFRISPSAILPERCRRRRARTLSALPARTLRCCSPTLLLKA